MDRAATINEIIDQRPLSSFQITTMVLCGMVIVLDGFDTQSIGFLAPSIAETLRVSVKTFGPVFMAALIGLMISSMTAGPIADRWGRKWPIVICTLLFGTFALLTARSTSFNQVVLFRFLTGLGLGGAMSNVVALMSEYAPKRLLAVFVTMLFCGMPAGALLGGLVSSVMLPRWGWQSVFYAGGILPFVLALVLMKALPESVRFLEVSGADRRKIGNIMARISPELRETPLSQSPISDQDLRRGMPVKHLFTEGRTGLTILLWIPYFMNLLILFLVVSWLPALLRQAGLPISAGITAISLFSVGGIIGSFVEGYLMNWLGAPAVLTAEFGLSALLIASLAFSASFPVTMTITFAMGFMLEGAQGGLNALAATVYPTAIRATGVGWAMGIGRIGSIVGPMLGGMMLARDWGPREIFLAGTIPALCAVAATLLSSWLAKSSSGYRPKTEVLEKPPLSPS
jgi:AAHS family 4-hydroxybenzoate transporter-like MFS transporter